MASRSERIRLVHDANNDLYTVQENTGMTSNVPAFLMKLWAIVEDPSTDDLISWDMSGKSFHIFDQNRFAHELLPFYFKHNNISSFIRQLNMYGFRKVVHVEQGGLKVEKDDVEFQHTYFQRGQEQLLDMIKRKATPLKAEGRLLIHGTDELSKVLNDVTQIHGKQENISASLEQLKRENEALWREVAILRQKHAKQQQIINKLIQFLLSIVGRRGMPGLKRKMPLMISDASELISAAEDGPSLSKRAHVFIDKGDHAYSVKSPSIGDVSVTGTERTHTQKGPIIHELLEEVTDSTFERQFSLPEDKTDGSLKSVALSESNPALPNTTVADTAASDLETENFLDELIIKDSISDKTSNSTQSSLTGDIILPSISQQHQKQIPETLKQEKIESTSLNSGQVALRSLKRQHSFDNPQTLTRDMTEHIEVLKSDIESLKDVLSSDQYNLDPNFLLGLFDPKSPLHFTLDSNLADNFLEEQQKSGGDAGMSTSVGNIEGHELWQYQPPEIMPDLFDFGDLDDTHEEDDDIIPVPVFFDTKESDLNTPGPSNIGDDRSSVFHLSNSVNTEEVD